MIQRVQTIFLLLVVLFMGLSFFFPLWQATPEGADIVYTLTNIQLISDYGSETVLITYYPYVFVAILAGICILVAIVEILKFKNRLLQMKLGALNAMLMAATMGVSVYFATSLTQDSFYGVGAYGPGLFLPAAAMICNILANRFIRKDERLVRSVDRIR